MPSFASLNLDGPPPSPPSYPPPPPPPPSPPPSSRPLARTALRVRSVNLRDFGGSDVGLANLAEQFHVNIYRRRWVSLSRSIDSDLSSSCSSASSLSPSGSVSDHFDCPDLVLGAGRRTRTWGSISLAKSLRRQETTLLSSRKAYLVLYMGE